MNGLTYRRATPEDVFPMMRLYQIATEEEPSDPVLLHWRKLDAELRSPSSLWLVGESGGNLLLFLSIQVDPAHRLAKISRVVVDPEWKDQEALLADAFPLLTRSLEPRVDVLYTTTRTLTLSQQELTLRLGFKCLGIFPNAPGADISQLNGITGYYFNDVLAKRKTGFRLHPDVLPLFEVARRECGLGVIASQSAERTNGETEPLPRLEILEAAAFVSGRFTTLKARQSTAASYYPFQVPNVLITDASQQVEMFARLSLCGRFAALIGEHLELPVDPTALYDEVARKLSRLGVTYLEVLSDAGDVPAIDCLVRAGFLPCAYLPSFMKIGERRRDCIVLGRTFERLFSHAPKPAEVSPIYLEYLSAYSKLEERMYLSRVRARAPSVIARSEATKQTATVMSHTGERI